MCFRVATDLDRVQWGCVSTWLLTWTEFSGDVFARGGVAAVFVDGSRHGLETSEVCTALDDKLTRMFDVSDVHQLLMN